MPIPSVRRREQGYSAIELVLYMPLLVGTIAASIQFALIYLANEYVAAAAREANRVARVTASADQGSAKGNAVLDGMADGLVTNSSVQVSLVNGGTEARTLIRADALQIVPFLNIVRVSEEVNGPVERFIEDTP